MDSLQLTQQPIATTGMLIRRRVEEVFDAFINPDITTKFWFTRSDGRLETGKPLKWTWEMYGITISAVAKTIEPNSRIVLEWAVPGAPATTVEWRFTSVSDGTFVNITHTGFSGTGDERVQQAVDSAQGFSFVLSGLKALLEHDIRLNLIADRYPAGVAAH